jgi:hypothetical protein
MNGDRLKLLQAPTNSSIHFECNPARRLHQHAPLVNPPVGFMISMREKYAAHENQAKNERRAKRTDQCQFGRGFQGSGLGHR